MSVCATLCHPLLDMYLPTIGHDITKFNTYVKLLIDGLRSRGEVTNDLLINLFKGYSSCSDREFIEYMLTKEDSFEEEMEITPSQLTTQRGNKTNAKSKKLAWFQLRPNNSELHKPKEWNGQKWFYCHKDTGGQCDGVWSQHN